MAPVLLVDRAVRLVDHDQVEVADAEAPSAVAASRRSAPSWSDRSRRRPGPRWSFSVTRLTGAESGRCALKAFDGLVHQRHAVGQEQHALDPVGAHEQVDSAITVRVLPAPVAITSSALRSPSRSKLSRDAADGAVSGSSARRSCR